jgi:glutathionyl-hydroquinone reductase
MNKIDYLMSYERTDGRRPMNTTEHDESKDRRPPTTSTKEGTFELELTPSSFREWVRDQPGARFRPEAGRYHLYVMYGCPWAHRTLIVRALKGLERAIDMTAVHYHLNEQEG